jgi:hypothetical protein
MDQDFTTGIPAGVMQGTPLNWFWIGSFVGLPLVAKSRYEWRATINGEGREEWTTAFTTVDGPQQAAA